MAYNLLVDGGIPRDIAFTIIEYNIPSKESMRGLFNAVLIIEENNGIIRPRICDICKKFISPQTSDYYSTITVSHKVGKYYCPKCLKDNIYLVKGYIYGLYKGTKKRTLDENSSYYYL